MHIRYKEKVDPMTDDRHIAEMQKSDRKYNQQMADRFIEDIQHEYRDTTDAEKRRELERKMRGFDKIKDKFRFSDPLDKRRFA